MARLKIALTFFGGIALFSIFLIVINDADDPVSFKSLFRPISFDNIRVASITETSAIVVGSPVRQFIVLLNMELMSNLLTLPQTEI